jgi:type IV secretion system protein VirD4
MSMMIARLMLIATVFVTIWTVALVMAMMPGVVWLLLLIGLGCQIARRRFQLTAFGTARFAGASDLRRAGMLDAKNGLVIGRVKASVNLFSRVLALFNPLLSSEAACEQFFRKRTGLVRLPKAAHTSVFAPSGAGKNVSIVEPFLLTSEESCIVTDIKGENAELTGQYREKVFGHKVMRLDPWRLTTDKPSRCNVLDLIDPNDPEALDKIRALAAAIVEKNPNEREPHWREKAEKFIAGAMATVIHFCPPELRSLQEVAEILANKAFLAQAIERLRQSTMHGGLLARMGNEMALSQDKELDGILSTANRSLAFLGTLAVVESTQCTSDFDLSALYAGNGATIYLIIPLQYLTSHAALMRLWVTAFTKYIVGWGIKNQRTVNVVLDECAAVMEGHGKALEEMLTVGRGFKLKVTAIFQSMAQLKKLFPEGQEGVLLANTSQIFFAVQDPQTAQYVSERLGEETIVVTSGSTSTGTSHQSGDQGQRSTSYSTNGSDNWAQQGRRLLKPEEVMALPDRIAITFTPGVPPICSRLVRYYEEDFRESWLGKLFARARMVVVSTALLLLALMTAGLVLSPLLYRHPQPPVVIDDPFEGLDTRSFEKR